MTPAEHREEAERLLERARDLSPSLPARNSFLLEGLLHAALAGAPATDVVEVLAWGEKEPVATIPAPDPEPAPAPTKARPRRTTKKTASSKEATS